jgi:imidazolonepropionase-like amidohydrolase
MRFLPLLLLMCVAAARAVSADLALVGGTVIPSPDAAPLSDAVVLVRDGRIAAVGTRAEVTVPSGVEVIDCSGKFITAGFTNAHIHVLNPELLNAAQTPADQLNATLETMFTRWGFTTIFDIASPVENTLALRARLERGELRGPRLLTVGEPVWTRAPIYVVDYFAAHGIVIKPTPTAELAVARVQAQAAKGANGIKLFTGSMQARGAVANMDAELVRAAVAEADRHGLPVFAHPHNTEGLEAAIAGGVDILAHTAPMSPAWTPEFVDRLKAARIALIPTLTLFRAEGESAKVPPAELERWIEHAVAQVRAFHAAGGEILFGTDIGYIAAYDTAEEYQLLARAGLDFRALLAALTTAPAARFGDSGKRGRVAPGFEADLVVLAGDPAQDVTALARVDATLRAGRFIYRAR